MKVGDRVRLRLYNASQDPHSMHVHGFDMTIVGQNGHPRATADQEVVATV